MTPRLYVETNFIVGYAKEQHESQEEILSLAQASAIDLRLPAVAIMECYKSWERDRERKDRLSDVLQAEIDDVLDRKFVPEGARDFSHALSGASTSVARRLDRARARTARCVSVIASSGRLLALPVAWAVAPRNDALIPAEPDDMILSSIIADATADPGESIFLTENSYDFEQPSVMDALKSVGIRYMYNTDNALSRIRSLLK